MAPQTTILPVWPEDALVKEKLQASCAATNDTASCESTTDTEASTDDAEFSRRYSLDSTNTSFSIASGLEGSKSRVKAANVAHPARAKGIRREIKNSNPPRCCFGATGASLNPSRGAFGTGATDMLSRIRKQGQSVLRDMQLQDKTKTELHASKAAVMAPPGLEPKSVEWLTLGGEPMHVPVSSMPEASPRGSLMTQEIRCWAKCPPGLESTLVASRGPPGIFASFD